MSLIENIQNRGLKDILNPKKWVIYLKNKAYLWGEPVNKEKEDPSDVLSYCEQVVMRTIACPGCLKAGKCIGDGTPGSGCGCPMPDAIVDKTNFCSEGNWPEAMPTQEWENYKQDLGLTFKIDFN
jgi:hypothetical protein